MSQSQAVLVDQLWPQEKSASLVRFAALAVIGSLIVAVAAQILVPMYPVPMTLQTLAVLGIGAAYGARLGAATLTLYMVECLAGLPFRAGGQAGFFQADGAVISSGGYMIGFILAAALVGWLAEKGWASNPLKMAAATLLGGALLYVPGLLWLGVWASQVKGVAGVDVIQTTLAWGFTPFLLGDVVKALIAGLGIGAIKS
jgi:biotin transport system substrate-specific component